MLHRTVPCCARRARWGLPVARLCCSAITPLTPSTINPKRSSFCSPSKTRMQFFSGHGSNPSSARKLTAVSTSPRYGTTPAMYSGASGTRCGVVVPGPPESAACRCRTTQLPTRSEQIDTVPPASALISAALIMQPHSGPPRACRQPVAQTRGVLRSLDSSPWPTAACLLLHPRPRSVPGDTSRTRTHNHPHPPRSTRSMTQAYQHSHRRAAALRAPLAQYIVLIL